MRILLGVVSVLFLLFVLVVISLRSGKKKDDTVDAAILEEDEVAILVQVEEDEQEEELVATVPITPPLQVEMEEPTLADELEAKSIAGEGNARLNRRMKRKQDREIAEIVSKDCLRYQLQRVTDVPLRKHYNLSVAELNQICYPVSRFTSSSSSGGMPFMWR